MASQTTHDGSPSNTSPLQPAAHPTASSAPATVTTVDAAARWTPNAAEQESAEPVILSSSTDEELLYSTTITHHALDNQFIITSAMTSLVHTTPTTVREAILCNFPGLVDAAQTNLHSETPTLPTTFSFVSLITLGKSSSGRPTKTLVSFNIRVDTKGDTLTFTTPPGASYDDASTGGTTVDNANGTTSSDAPPSAATQRAAIRANVTGAVTITPSPYECASVTAMFESVAADDGGGKQTGPPSSLSRCAVSATKGMNTLMKTARTVKAEGQKPPAPAVAEVAQSAIGNMKTALKALSPSKPQNTTTYFPSATATAILDHLLNLIPALHKMYARYDEVDAAM